MSGVLLWLLGICLVAVFTIPYYLRLRRAETRAALADVEALKYGLKEPVSLHPVVDPGRCIGMGSCISVCPEYDVLGLRDGQAFTISPARCIGHGLCEQVCAVEAIQLVFGSEKRGVELPRIKSNFETNVDGIYVIGELGGMGLIRNAFEQGQQCVAGIAREEHPVPPDALDVAIVGCGPAGLSAALSCLHRKLKFVVIDKEGVGGSVRHYPRKKLVMTSPVKIPSYGFLRLHEVVKEELVSLWEDIVRKSGLEIMADETVGSVTSTADSCFLVQTQSRSYKTKRVILAIGRRGVPRKLGVEGEDLSKVSYSLREPEAYSGDRIVVVGGGDSAVEAAMALGSQPGNRVHLSYRKDRLSRVKPANLERFEAATVSGSVRPLWSTNIVRITGSSVVYRNGDGSDNEIENDYVFVFAGGVLPTAFLKSCGIQIDTKFGEPLSRR